MLNKKNALKMMVVSLGVTAMLGFAHGADAATHEVKKGETLYRIALENNMTVNELKQMNNLKTNTIYVGQKIQVKDAAVTTYVVKRGDTLAKIAKDYKLTVTQLKQLNNLKSDLIFPGQKLQLKAETSATYQVKRGDTLFSISKSHNMTVDELKKLNNLKTNIIFPGQQLVVKGTQVVAKEIKLTVQDGFQFLKEEPNKYQLFAKKDGSFFVRVELIDSKASMADLKTNATNYLKTIGTVQEVKDVKGLHPFYHGNELYLASSNANVRQSIVIKKINGQLIQFTLHLPDKEESEYYTPNLLKQLQTIKF